MRSNPRPGHGHADATMLRVALVLLATILSLTAFTAAAQANGTLKVTKGGDRVVGNNTLTGYASGIPGAEFEYATNAAFTTGVGTLPLTDASGVATTSLPAGTYWVREKTPPAGVTWSAVNSLWFDESSGNPSSARAYVAKVVIANSQTTEAFPNRTLSSQTNAGGSGSPFVNIRKNAVFPDRCGLKLLLVLDRSGSIGAYKASYQAAATAFVDALENTPTELGIINFNNALNGVAPLAPVSLNGGLGAAQARANIASVYNNPTSLTNWDVALQAAAQATNFSGGSRPDMVVFITDGNPTTNETSSTGSGNVALIDLTTGIASANLVKSRTVGAGTVKMLAVGVGAGVTADNLKVVSGPNLDDDYAVSSVDALKGKLEEIAARTCGARIHIRKRLAGSATDAAGWKFAGTSTTLGITPTYKDGDRTTHGSPAETQVILNNVPEAGAQATVTEDATGQPLSEFNLDGVVCRTTSYDSGTLLAPTSVPGGVSFAGVPRGADYYCTFTNSEKRPNVTLAKTTSTPTISAGNVAKFAVTVTNAGPGTAKNVVVSDLLPAGPTWSADGGLPSGCSIANVTVASVTRQQVTCSFATLGVTSLTFNVKATTTASECGTYSNTVTGSVGNQGDLAPESATVTCNKPNVTLAKTTSTGTIDAGDVAKFAVTVTNAGPGTAKDVVVFDLLPEGPTWSADGALPAGCSLDDVTIGSTTRQQVTCTFATLGVGAATFNVKATTSSTECGTYANTVGATGGNTGAIAGRSATVTCNKPNVTLTKTAQDASVDAGDPIRFTITATNSDVAGTGTATGVVIKDELPAGVTWSTATSGCTIAGDPQILTCDPITMAKGATFTVVVTAVTSFEQCGSYDNTATFSSTNAPGAASNPASITCHAPKVTLAKAAQNATVDAGDPIRFTITATNSSAPGTGTAKGVVITDDLPGNVDWSTGTAGCTVTGAIGSRVLTCDAVTLAAGDAHAVVVGATTTFAGCAVYDNTAKFSSTNSGGGQSNKATITCRKPATIRIDKLVTGEPGSTTKFGFTSDLTPNAGDQGTTFALSAADAPAVFTVRPDRTYTITEDSPYAKGYRLAKALCAPTTDVEGQLAARSNQQPPQELGVSTTPQPGDDITCAFTNERLTAAQVVLKGPKDQSTYIDGTVSYTYDVTNNGTSDLTIPVGEQGFGISDDTCPGPISGPAVVGGESGDPSLLEPGETWRYTCSIKASDLFKSGSDPITNTVTVIAKDQAGAPVGPTHDTAVTRLLSPAIALKKSGPATAIAGELISYSLVATNTGNTVFNDGMVVVADAKCQQPPTLTSRGVDQTPATFDPGDAWTYTCQVQTAAGQTEVVNVGTVNGTDVGGKAATASSTATTTLSQPSGGVEGSGETGASGGSGGSPSATTAKGTARLTGTVGCATAKYAKASIVGSKIARVTFYVNGKRVKTLTKPNIGNKFQLRTTTKSLKYGAYKVRAKVEFKAASKSAPRTLSLRYDRCRPHVIAPHFTG